MFDFDVYPSLNKIENLRLKGSSLIIARSSTDICLINHFYNGWKAFTYNKIHFKWNSSKILLKLNLYSSRFLTEFILLESLL